MAGKRWDEYTEDTTLNTASLIAVETNPSSTHVMRKMTLLNVIKEFMRKNVWEKGASIDNPPAGYMAVYSDSNGFFYTKDESGNLRALTRPATFEWMPVAAADNCAIGDGKIYFTIPSWMNGMNLTAVHARVITAGTTGTMDIQIANVTDSVDMLSTKLTIDSGETGSDTAATAYVIDGTKDDVATNDLLRIDVDAVHSGTAAKGLIIRLEFNYP